MSPINQQKQQQHKYLIIYPDIKCNNTTYATCITNGLLFVNQLTIIVDFEDK